MSAERAKLKIACPGCLQKLDVTDLEPFARVNCPRCGGEVIAPRPFGTLLLEEPLGHRRGVGAYRGLDLTLDREVLVRVLEHGTGSLGESFLALARRAAGVNHPGVLPIYSCGSEQGMPYVVSQFMAGGLLAARVPDWSASEESVRQAAEWMRSVVAGLQAAAGQGVVHGAVSPLSIFLDADAKAKVGDFGLDLLLFGGEAPWRTCGSDVAGYLSPEALAGQPPTVAADVFGAGAVLYHLLTGQLPCGAISDGEGARRFWDERRAPCAPRALNPQVPEELSELCVRMVAADPGHRPSDLADLVQSLTSACKTRAVSPLKAAAARARSLAAAAPAAQPSVRPAVTHERSAGTRATWVDWLIAAGLVVLLGMAGGLYVRAHGWPHWLVAPSVPEEGGRAKDPQGPPALAEATPALPGQAVPATPAAPPAGGPEAGEPAPAAVNGPVPVVRPGAAEGGSAPPARPGAAEGGSAPPGAELLAGRPKPAGLDFLGAKGELARYLKSLPPEAVPAERARLELIGDTRGYLVRLMKYVAFREGKETDLRLRSGSTIRGAVVYGNEAQLAVRRPGDNSLFMLAWDDLAFEQIVGILDFYIQLRSDQGQIAGGAPNKALRQEVAEDCLRTAVLCDWYERPELARRYARKAVDADPGAASRVSSLLPGPLP